MAIDKAIDSTQLDSDLTSVANAIRTKGGTSAQLAFPAGFVSAIGDIPSGGGGDNLPAFLMGTATTVEDSTVTKLRDFAFRSYTNITSVKVPNCTQVGGNCFYGCSNLQILAFPSLSNDGLGGSSIASSGVTTLDLGTSFGQIKSGNIQNAANLNVLILRKTSLVSLANTSQFNGTPFRSGGGGGTIYIPKVLYDHLGDNSSSDYKAASNWSTINGYGTITWAKIEGSIYENAYADGTPIT